MNDDIIKRLRTALIVLPVLFLIVYGTISFFVLALMASFICLYEFYGIALKDVSIKHEVCITGFIMMTIWLLLLFGGFTQYLWMVAVVNFMIMAVIAVFRFHQSPDILHIIAYQAFGVIYISGLISFLLLIHQFEKGHFWIYLTFMMIFACDTGAYFAGKQFGIHALCKAVSPKKTIEGYLGGWLSCVITCLALATLFRLRISIEHMLGLSTVVGLFAPLGDLFESAFKRVADIKDSGNLLPGHGGLLDRVDALLFSTPLIYGYKVYFIG